MEKLKVHLYGAPHMNVMYNTKQMATCAYTTKLYLIAKILKEMGHELIYYGIEGNNCPATESVDYLSKEIWDTSHTRDDKAWHDFGMHLESYQVGQHTVVEEINKRLSDPSKEVVLTTFGLWSENIRNINSRQIEWGIGYGYPWTPYKVFESYAWQHSVYQKLGNNYEISGPKWTDAVIPGYVDKDQFTFKDKKDDYLLFVGRIMDTKGVHIAIDLAQRNGLKLVVAGNGDIDMVENQKNVHYVGVADNTMKRALYANAKATLCMTQYVEPFGNVHIESLMSGTPVITTDWGVYTETVPNGLVGFRGRTWQDHQYALDNIDSIDPQNCRDWAEANFSLQAVYPKFNSYFNHVAATNGEEYPYYASSNPDYCFRFTDYMLQFQEFQRKKREEQNASTIGL